MDLYGIARTSADALKDDASAVEALRTERATLAQSILTAPKSSFELTSSTVAGQTITGQVSMTKGQRLKLLGVTLKMIDAGGEISRVSGVKY